MSIIENANDKDVDAFIKMHFNNAITHTIEVAPEYSALLHYCFQNVINKVSQDGGSLVVGWAIQKTANLVEAEFHGVWRSLDGQLIDITPSEDGQRKIVFVEIPNLVYDGGQRDNIRQNISGNPIADDLILVCEAMFRIRNRGNRRFQHGIIKLPAFEANELNQLMQAKQNLAQKLLFKQGRNSSCICGSGDKYKHCCESEIKSLNQLYR